MIQMRQARWPTQGSVGEAIRFNIAGVGVPILAAALICFTATSALAQSGDSKEIMPTSRGLIATMTTLTQPGYDEASLRADAASMTTTHFTYAGNDFALATSTSSAIARLAFGAPGTGGVACLVQLPAISAGFGSADPNLDAHYALATVSGTKVTVWGLYYDVPSDKVLGQRMLAALAHLAQPMATFDPTFVPGPGPGPASYMLH